MPTFDEILFDRVANLSRRTGKKYAVMSRGAWSERIIRPLTNEVNRHEFMGRIVNPQTHGATGVEERIGFFHPMFNGYAPRYSYVEVVECLNEDLECRYLARGRGVQSIAAFTSCIDDPPPEWTDPCLPPDCETTAWGLAPTSAPQGTEDSTLIYDYDTSTWDMGPNEVPAYLTLPGYDGATIRPTTTRPLLLSWSPNLDAFQPTFQLCGQVNIACGSGGVFFIDCCALIPQWEALYGPGWCAIVKEMILNNELGLWGPFTKCGWLYQWIVANC